MSNFSISKGERKIVKIEGFFEAIDCQSIFWESKCLSYKRLIEFLNSIEGEFYFDQFEPINEEEKEDIEQLKEVVKTDTRKFSFENLKTQITSLINNSILMGNTDFKLKKVQLDLGNVLYEEEEPKTSTPVEYTVSDVVGEKNLNINV